MTRPKEAASIDNQSRNVQDPGIQDASTPARPRVAVLARSSEAAWINSIVEKLDGDGLEVVATERHSADYWSGRPSEEIHAAVVVIPSRAFSEWATSDLNPFVEECKSRGVAILMVFPEVSVWSHGERRRYSYEELAAALDDLIGRAKQRFDERVASRTDTTEPS